MRKTGAAGQQLEEAKTINKSLSALGWSTLTASILIKLWLLNKDFIEYMR